MLKKISLVLLLILSILILQPACKQRNLSQKDKDLFESVRSGNTTEIVRLLKAGANVNTKDNHGFTALHIASGRGDLATIELLINKGANVSAQNDGGDTPLHDACMNGKIEAAKLLIEKGADVNAKNKSGQNPIYPAAERGNLELVKLLVSKGSKLQTTGYTPLHSAMKGFRFYLSQQSQVQCKELIEYFLSQGVNINTKGNSQNGGDATILYLASMCGDKEIIEFLIGKGAEVDARIMGGTTPLFMAALGGNKEAAKVLIAYGAHVNARDDSNNTPLYLPLLMSSISPATMKGRLEVIEILLANGADVNTRNKQQYAPLFYAIIGLGPLQNDPEYNATYKAIIEALLEKGADPNTKDGLGRTPLKLAEREPEIKELLIKYGAKQ
jgi:ankyrin repeat protein